MPQAAATLLDTVVARADSHSARTAERAGAVAFVTVLTIVAAQVSIPLPFTPVPFTFQPMIVLVGGLALGARLGMASQILYLALGIAGLPVFAASPVLPPGVARLLGPTGGYLLSYPFAAFVTGCLAQRAASIAGTRRPSSRWPPASSSSSRGCRGSASSRAGDRHGRGAQRGLYPFVIPDLLSCSLRPASCPGPVANHVAGQGRPYFY